MTAHPSPGARASAANGTLCLNESSIATSASRAMNVTRQTGLSLFHSSNLFFSGKNVYRRSFLRRLDYIVILPYELPNYRAVKLEGYRERNPMREANDKAFKSAMSTLFRLLAAWEEGSKLTLSLEARGRDETLEPETEELEEAHTWEAERDGRRVVTPYQARFPDGVSVLPEVSSIDHLVFDSYSQRIWKTPDERVAAAWGFSLDDMVVETPWPSRLPDVRWISATLEGFPPPG
ncbi:hypothetical protein ASPCAL08954 [Aspergillus calidoustus]|uniref:Uncharacterized protein n=1 Tax=Aspergillus calidoustus TaxID=454130 RepID=A0A0U5CR39_ASPCI|nr:hypothetical protein ASPCAL08954 [Aspergillus calidoustus]